MTNNATDKTNTPAPGEPADSDAPEKGKQNKTDASAAGAHKVAGREVDPNRANAQDTAQKADEKL